MDLSHPKQHSTVERSTIVHGFTDLSRVDVEVAQYYLHSTNPTHAFQIHDQIATLKCNRMSKLPITIAGNARGRQQVSFVVRGEGGGRQHSRFRNIQHYTDTNQKFFERVRALNLWAVNNSVSIHIVECRFAGNRYILSALSSILRFGVGWQRVRITNARKRKFHS